MTKTRLEAFSDAVIAIIMTIMVLELRPPGHASWDAFVDDVAPELGIYVLSFAFLAIYWNNHHHLIHTVKKVNGKILWANMHLLFWLSLTPFVTAWMGEDFADVSAAAYGGALLLSAIAYYVLQGQILATHAASSPLRGALGSDIKGKASPVLYAVAIVMAFVSRWVSVAIYVFVAAMWLIPDRRIESAYDEIDESAGSA
ncbi:MAG: TMEM175 family protein [Actinomycetota bacterium]